MSPVPANIVVNFIANYNGNHRVCYRQGTSGPYTCVTVGCSLGTCSASLPIFVDNETCTTLAYEGYVQATCQDISSSVDRIPFGLSFVPSPGCKSYTVTCAVTTVAAATITNAGTNYNPSIPPSVLITGGGGTGAAASSTVGTGAITSTSSLTAGSGYTNGTFTNVGVTGGSGSGALATVIVSGGIVTSVVITNAGTGYQNFNVLGLDPTTMGGASPSVAATFHITSNYGLVIAVTITNPGSGYTSVPTIVIAAAGGVQATATATLTPCATFTTHGCSGGSVNIPEGVLALGDQISVCNIGGPVTPGSNYTVIESGNCLCSCVSATIGVSGPVGHQVRYFYNRCGNGVKTGILTVGGSPSSVIDCIVPGSIVFQTLVSGTIGTVTLGGSC